MHKNSFVFGTIDMYERYGICVLEKQTYLKPRLRERKITIPQRSGSYDFGAKYYDERDVKLKCDTMSGLSEAQKRELAYDLSKKERITFWDEQDKYYIGRIYDTTAVDKIGQCGHTFNLTFVCDPFAYGETKNVFFPNTGILVPEYAGTAPSPTRLEITNEGNNSVIGVQITIRKRRDSN